MNLKATVVPASPYNTLYLYPFFTGTVIWANCPEIGTIDSQAYNSFNGSAIAI